MAITKIDTDMIANDAITADKIVAGALDTQLAGYLSTNSFATESYVGTAISNLVDSSPATLDTLNELAAALGDDPNFATTTATAIGLKAPLASPSFTGAATFSGDVRVGENLDLAELSVRNAGTPSKRQLYIGSSANGTSLEITAAGALNVGGAATFSGAITTVGSAVAATNVEFRLNGVAGKAKRVAFADSGTDQWLIGHGAASEGTPFEIYNANGQMSLSIAKATSAATFVGNVNSTAAGENFFSNVGNVSLAVQSNATDKISIGVEQAVAGTFVASGGALKFRVGGYTAAFDKAQIDPSGNLGLGVTPSYKLDVSGSPGDVVRFTGDANNSMRAYLGSGYQIFQCVNSGTTNQVGYVSGNFYVQTAGTTRMTLDASGNVEIPDGNLSFAAGHGIDFSATANAGGTSNATGSELLDDYEEGTWYPYLGTETQLGGAASGNNNNKYVKIGRFVHCTGWFSVWDWANITSGTYIMIRNLPFAPEMHSTGLRVSYASNLGSSTYGYGHTALSAFYLLIGGSNGSPAHFGRAAAPTSGTAYAMLNITYYTNS